LGSRRVDDLLLRRPVRFERQFSQRGPAFNFQNSRNIDLHKVSIVNEPVPFRLNGPDTHVTLLDCHFDALGWSRDVAAAELFGNRAATFWSAELAIGRAKDEVLAALTELNKSASLRVPIGDYVNTKKQKSVLVLGDYSTEGILRLEAISNCLTNLGYNPLLVRDVPDIFASDIRQKVVILGGLARFVIIDDSSRSGHLVEIPLADQNGWTTVLLHSGGERGSWMTAGLDITRSNFHEESYDPAEPVNGVERAAAWAESRIGDLERKYRAAYPWRAGSLSKGS
jgi:hypothetical protein